LLKIKIINMKNYTVLFAVAFLAIIFSCGSSKETKEEKKFELVKTKSYVLNPELSKLAWVRNVDYKNLKTKVLLGKMYVDLSMENVQFETNGEAKVVSGKLECINDLYTAAEVEIDLSLTRFYSQEEEAFFKTESYPAAILKIKSFEKDTTSDVAYIATADLTLNEKTQEIKFPVDLTQDANSNIVFKGTYLMQTSEWPVLKQPDPANVNHDEISFGFDLIFGNVTEKVDTVWAK
jgi:hypothetical protein